MDNTSSQPQIKTPRVPTNFEALAGETKTQFAQAILNVIAKSLITGVEPNVTDIASLQSKVVVLEEKVKTLEQKVQTLEDAP